MRNRLVRGSVATAIGVGALLAPSAAPAAENQFTCTAAPLTGTLVGQNLPLPTAGNPSAACTNAATTPNVTTPSIMGLPALKLGLLNGTTAASDAGVFAAAGLTDLSVGSVPIPLPQIPLPAELGRIEVGKAALAGIVPEPLYSLLPNTTLATVDLRPAIQALGSLPSRNLLGAQALYSNLTGVCTNGQPNVTGGSRVLGAQVLGLDVDPNKTVDQAINLVDTTNIALNSLNLQLATVSVLDGTLNLTAAQVLQGLVAQVPNIQIPAQVAQVKLTPSSTEKVNGFTIQRALRAQISLAGQSIADLSIGTAAIGVAGNPCAAQAGVPRSAPEAALECTKRKLTLIDVVPQGRRVRLYGAADKSLVGKRVKIRFQATGKDVATTTVKKDGSFTTTAAMPARNVRNTNRARYIARAGGEKSLNLKLARRMVISSVTSRNGKVTIKGRVIRPLASPIAKITLKRRVTCKRLETVKSFRPSRSGRFTVTTRSPKNLAATVYRLQTRVRKFASNPKTYPTFTLPRAVDL